MSTLFVARRAVPIFAFVAACGGGASSIPATAPARESGQSALMDKSFAGANKCNPKSHERPFVIEWDATDTSSFEARASTDVVFVKYEGCELKVLDGCADDAVRGALGTYRPVEWTSGSVEKIDIANEGELFAKLPLGVASLDARVQAGEQFHMEYFAAGVRTATRSAVFRKDLARIHACSEATHFIYGYNVGAFALGSTKDIKAQAGASVWGFGGGANKRSASSAEKKGGLLSSCRGESAKEISSCKTPIRLTLREVSEGENPDVAASKKPDTKETLNAAGRINRERQGERTAGALATSANTKMQARDGRGCLADLDARDRLDPSTSSSDPKSLYAMTRATCLMLAGQCDAGKALERKFDANVMQSGPEMIDSIVAGHAAEYCTGSLPKGARDRVLKYATELKGARQNDVLLTTCVEAFRGLKVARDELLKGGLDPNDEDDRANTEIFLGLNSAPNCFAKAGDCKTAWAVTREVRPTWDRPMFEKDSPLCKGK
jgi:hypothetical protein